MRGLEVIDIILDITPIGGTTVNSRISCLDIIFSGIQVLKDYYDIDVNSNKLGGTVAKRNEKLVKMLNGV